MLLCHFVVFGPIFQPNKFVARGDSEAKYRLVSSPEDVTVSGYPIDYRSFPVSFVALSYWSPREFELIRDGSAYAYRLWPDLYQFCSLQPRFLWNYIKQFKGRSRFINPSRATPFISKDYDPKKPSGVPLVSAAPKDMHLSIAPFFRIMLNVHQKPCSLPIFSCFGLLHY